MVGAVKAGTTSLHQYMGQHPQIFLSPIKETNFFSRADMDHASFRKDYSYDVAIDFEKYLSQRPLKERHIAHVEDFATYQQLFFDAPAQSVLGEVCNSYLMSSSAAKAIKDQNPKTKIIAVLRNPIDRAFSHYLMNIKEGKTSESNFLKEIKSDLALSHKGWGVSHQYHEVGHYYSQLKRFYEVFPSEQIKVVLFEDLKADGQQFLNELFNFIGVDSQEIDTTKQLNTAGRPRLGKLNYLLTQLGIISILKGLFPRTIRQKLSEILYTKKGLPTLQPAERLYLLEYYKEETSQLEQLIGKNLEEWKR